MAAYMAQRIIDGAQEYIQVIERRPDLKDEIDAILIEKQMGYLIQGSE